MTDTIAPAATAAASRSAPSLSPAELRGLSKRANAPGIARTASHFAAIGVTGAAIWFVRDRFGLAWTAPLILLQCCLVTFLFMAVHETAHKTAFLSRWMNLVVGHICAFTIMLPYEYYSLFHWDHHRYTQDPEKDPELVTGPKPESHSQLILAFSGVLQVIRRFQLLVRHAILGKVTVPWVPEDKRALVIKEARVYLAVYVLLVVGSIAVSSTLLLWVWFVPLFLGQSVLRPYLYTEHSGCADTKSAYENTRTTYTNAVVRWLAWNMPYHVEHHAFPAVPFHALPRLNQIIANRIVYHEQGYSRAIPQAWRALRARAMGRATARQPEQA